jgi:hypothetical protein
MAKERITPDHAARAGIRELRERYALGCKLDREFPSRAKYGDRLLRKRAKELGTGLTELVYTRLFARRYTRQDLNELLRLRPPKGRPLCWNHVLLLLAVKNLRVRRALQQEAARNGWTVQQLRLESRLRVGKQHTAGRKLQMPHSPEAALLQLAEQSDRLRLFAQLFAASEGRLLAGLGKTPKKGLQKRRDLLHRTIQSITDLSAKSAALVDQLRALDQQLARRK